MVLLLVLVVSLLCQVQDFHFYVLLPQTLAQSHRKLMWVMLALCCSQEHCHLVQDYHYSLFVWSLFH